MIPDEFTAIHENTFEDPFLNEVLDHKLQESIKMDEGPTLSSAQQMLETEAGTDVVADTNQGQFSTPIKSDSIDRKPSMD